MKRIVSVILVIVMIAAVAATLFACTPREEKLKL